MGNCLVHQAGKKLIKVTSVDEETLEATKMPTEEIAAGGRVVRIKLVLTRQELEDMLRKGWFSDADIRALLRREEGASGASEKEGRSEWKPALERIPEGDDLCFEDDKGNIDEFVVAT